jgi:hypothetical protein
MSETSLQLKHLSQGVALSPAASERRGFSRLWLRDAQKMVVIVGRQAALGDDLGPQFPYP